MYYIKMNISLFLFLLITPPLLAQKLQSSSSSSSSTPTTDFTCPEDFGYFPHPSDCTQYYVCVFGGALLESCTGGLMYSHDLQTCDWPRNVYCYNGTLPLDNNIEQSNQQGRQQETTRGSLVRSRGSSNNQQSTRSNPSYSYNPIKIETYGQLSRAAEESSISGGKKKVNLPDDEYQQQRSGRSYEGSLPNYKEEIYQQNQGSTLQKNITSNCPACSSSAEPKRRLSKRSISLSYEDLDKDVSSLTEEDYSSRTSSHNDEHDIALPHRTGIFQNKRHDRALFEKEKNRNSIKEQEKDTQQTSYSHRVSSPGNILYPPSYYQTPTYGLVNIDKLRSSFSTSSKLRNNNQHIPPPRVVKITSTIKPIIAADSAQTGSYFSSQQAPLHPQTILDYHAPSTKPHDYAPPSPTSNYNTHQLVKPKSPPPTSYSYTPQQQQRWNHLITQKTQQQQQPPGQPGYYNGPNSSQQQQQYYKNKQNDEKRIVLKTPSSPLLLPQQQQQQQQQQQLQQQPQQQHPQPSSHNNNPLYNNEQEKRLSDFVTNAYLNRLKGTTNQHNNPQTILDYHRPRPNHNEIPTKPNLPFISFGGRAPPTTTFGPSHIHSHHNHHHHHHHQNHVQQIHQQVLPNKGSVSRGKYTGTPNKYYDNSPAVVAVPQQDDYAGTDDVYANQRYAANVGNQTGGSYYYSPAGATASAADDDDASYYVYDDEEEEVVPQQPKYTPTQDYKYTQQQQPNPYTRVPQTQQPQQQIITRRPTITQQAPIIPTTTRTSTRSRTRTSAAAASSSGGSSTSTRSRPTNKPKSSIVKGQAAPVRDVYLDQPSRPENIYETPATNSPATKCRKDLCVLPDCSCGGKEIPGGLRAQETPQIVLLTFDDSVNDLNKNLYRDLFEKGRKNPNGCPISATFYVSHEWTDYSQVQNLAADGHEIASHSVSHSFGEQYSQKKWDREINGQREILAAYGGVKMSEIRGMRAPFLAIGGNNMFKMLHDSNFTYDSSMPIYENRPPSWPYTLDYRIFHDCMIPPCPTKSYAGVWEVPMVMWQDLKGGRCSMGDACSNPPTAEGVYQMLAKNFERHYTTNRAPFGLYYHAAWFTQPHHKEGFEAFLDTLVQMDDVWLVTNWQALQWIRNPTPNNRALNFAPWSCHDLKDRPPRCNHPKVCNLWHKSGVRYMKTCQHCPQQYPWTGNTGVPYSNSL